MRKRFENKALSIERVLSKEHFYGESMQKMWPKAGPFWVTLKITSVNLCKPVHDIINYSTFTCPFKPESVEREKITKLWISRERKELFRRNEKHFS